MRRNGRPLRFLGATLGGWVVLRTGLLWPTIDTPGDLIRAFVPPAAAAARDRPRPAAARGRPALTRAVAAVPIAPASPRAAGPASPGAAMSTLADPDGVGEGSAIMAAPYGAIPAPLRPTPVADPPRRLAASLWGIVRAGIAAGLPGGQLGGSQAGVRVAYALGTARQVALTARVSTPLEGRGSEAAVGVELKVANLPVRIIAEQRVSLDGGGGGQAIYAVGGIAPVPIVAGFRLEGYAQAGVVVRGGAVGFADGATRLARAVSRDIDVGVGAWGGVQPGVARVDVGPTIGLALPVARRRVRVSLDWRHRVAGLAQPRSGPALSIGSDF